MRNIQNIAVVFAGLFVYCEGTISSRCLRCICEVESGCKAIGCNWDVNSESCGYYQIKQNYWIDCKRPGSSLSWCGDNSTCSTNCVKNYMSRYIKSNGCTANCESYARMHNGGPKACDPNHYMHGRTNNYWRKVQAKGCNSSS
ncbi:lysozyme-like [Crassostrea angulata]|uniref:lysozyme-like n=1 Tax=Magallana angulata TaxID=2784310 RepID=UPI0022B0851F|nr:lysozyme-like [Crassostrea angulata]